VRLSEDLSEKADLNRETDFLSYNISNKRYVETLYMIQSIDFSFYFFR